MIRLSLLIIAWIIGFVGAVVIGSAIGMAIGWAMIGPPDPSSILGRMFL